MNLNKSVKDRFAKMKNSLDLYCLFSTAFLSCANLYNSLKFCMTGTAFRQKYLRPIPLSEL